MPPENLKFIIDTQLPPQLAPFLKKMGIDAIHTSNYRLGGHLMSDSEIIHVAIVENRIIVTKDIDFFDHFLTKGSPPKVLLLQLGNIKNSELFTLIEYNIDKIRTLFEDSNNLILLNKLNLIAY